MKYEEYEAMAQGLTAENAPVVLQSILVGVKDDLAERDALIEQRDGMESKIKDLQDTNIKLFLSQTGEAQTEEQTEEEKVEDMNFDEYINYLKEKKGEE